MEKATETEWRWWAGRDEEYLTVGPCATREEAIAAATDDIGAGEGDFTILEATLPILAMDAGSTIGTFVETIGDDMYLYSSEHEYPSWDATKEQMAEATAEMQAFFDQWMDKWRSTFTSPNVFASTRNREVIENSAPAQGVSA